MSGECENCSEHCLDCICNKIMFRKMNDNLLAEQNIEHKCEVPAWTFVNYCPFYGLSETLTKLS